MATVTLAALWFVATTVDLVLLTLAVYGIGHYGFGFW